MNLTEFLKSTRSSIETAVYHTRKPGTNRLSVKTVVVTAKRLTILNPSGVPYKVEMEGVGRTAEQALDDLCYKLMKCAEEGKKVAPRGRDVPPHIPLKIVNDYSYEDRL